MKRRFISVFGIALIGLLMAGCTTQKAIHYTNVPIKPVSADKPSLLQIQKAVERGAINRRWKIAVANENQVITSIHRNGLHSRYRITVAIDFTQDSYSIKHENTTPNLNFDGGNVHKAYNKEVNVLKSSIDYELKTMSNYPIKSEVVSPKPVEQKNEPSIGQQLRTLKGLHTDGIITDEEYKIKRDKLVKEL